MKIRFNDKIAHLYSQKIKGFENKKQLELYLAEEPTEIYSFELNL